MSDEHKEEPGIDQEPDGSQDDKVNLSKADFEAMQAKAAYYDKLASNARDFDLESPEEYVDTIENIANSKVSDSINKQPEEKPKAPETPKAPAGLSEEDRALLYKSNQIATAAALTAQWSEFQYKQSDLGQDERSTRSKKELTKLITGPEGSAVYNIAQKRFDGNVYQAADFYAMQTDPETLSRARKQGAASEAAKQGAKGSATLNTDGKTKEPNDSTAEERWEAETQKQRDAIAPSEKYEYPG